MHGTAADNLVRQLSTGRAQVDEALAGLTDEILDIRGRLFHRTMVRSVADAIVREISAFHAAQAWRAGVPKEELKAKAFGPGDNRLYAHALADLVAVGTVEEAGDLVRRRGFVPAMDPQSAAIREAIIRALQQGRFAPPGRDELAKRVTDGAVFDRMFRALLDEGTVVEVAPGVCFHRDVLEEIKQTVAGEIEKQGNITVAALRDRLATSRKYALTVLEYFDSIKLTKRIGDARVLLDRSVKRGS